MNEFDASQATILLIDDEREILDNLSKVLTAAGYRCLCAQDGEAAAKIISSQTPELIISDINLAGHSGLNLCEKLKQDTGLADVPLMFLSGAQIPDSVLAAVTDHLVSRNVQRGGPYDRSQQVDAMIARARAASAAIWD